jgi:uncharacterized protein YbjT (DUF2867 family)
VKVVVIGGSGLIGSKLVAKLRERGATVVAASPRTGVNTISGAGLADALAGACAVVDVTNSPSFEDSAVLSFFEASGRNLLAAETAASVGHHITLSIVGVDRNLESGYMRAKMAQETLVKASGRPYSIVRSTQFFEFLGSVADLAAPAETVHISPALVQPIAADDVVDVLATAAATTPLNATIEIAGPERMSLNVAVGQFLSSRLDHRRVVPDPHARYFGIALDDHSLMPGERARIGRTHYGDWLKGPHSH